MNRAQALGIPTSCMMNVASAPMNTRPANDDCPLHRHRPPAPLECRLPAMAASAGEQLAQPHGSQALCDKGRVMTTAGLELVRDRRWGHPRGSPSLPGRGKGGEGGECMELVLVQLTARMPHACQQALGCSLTQEGRRALTVQATASRAANPGSSAEGSQLTGPVARYCTDVTVPVDGDCVSISRPYVAPDWLFLCWCSRQLCNK